ncbi:MAG: carboxypeptidase-like regulatory domain-containing protein, partial [Terriglobia bacterium]
MRRNTHIAPKVISGGRSPGSAISCPIVMLLLCLLARSQSTSGLVTGVVSDPDNRVVPSAHSVFLNLETGQRRDLLTSSDGSFWLNGLPSGRYEARAEVEGFRSDVRTGVVVTVAEELVLNFKLRILPLSE